jgi:hypothetical protein
MAVVFQVDFPKDGPFGEESFKEMKEVAENIAAHPGLIWKIWTENAETKEAGGVYLFETMESARAYFKVYEPELRGAGFDIRPRFFQINERLTEITRGPR